ncbi:MAG: GMC family oxidoreductase [Gammaproteobacteria bacterium]
MKHICIIGSGFSGGVLASEISEDSKIKVTLLDCDDISKKFDNSLDLKKNKSSYLSFNSTGYGFGGTSNLWHGVMTFLDDCDYESISSMIKIDLKNEIEKVLPRMIQYFGDISILSSHEYKKTDKFFKSEPFLLKNHIIQKNPVRVRNIINDSSKKNTNLNLISNAIVISLKYRNSKITSVVYNQNGIQKELSADVFVISAGALESPRIILDSFIDDHKNHNTGMNLLDHPIALIGKLKLNRKSFHNFHGIYNLFRNNSLRLGLILKTKYKNNDQLNHSIFLRPSVKGNLTSFKKDMSLLISGKLSFTRILSILFNIRLLKLSFILLMEKVGIGYYTDELDITLQLEGVSEINQSTVKLSSHKDQYNRSIPDINYNFSNKLLSEIKYIQKLLSRNTRSNSTFVSHHVDYDDFILGSHHAGTCRMSYTEKYGVVDSNLKYFGIDNLYVCDASVLPKIGNANLSLTLVALAIRLSNHIKKNI